MEDVLLFTHLGQKNQFIVQKKLCIYFYKQYHLLLKTVLLRLTTNKEEYLPLK